MAAQFGGDSITAMDLWSRSREISGDHLVTNIALNGIVLASSFVSAGSPVVAAERRTITILGSMQDVAPYANRHGFNVLDLSNVPKEEWARENAGWLNDAIVRGDDIWLVTDPVKRSAELMAKYGTDQGSAYISLELPMLEQYSGVNVIDAFATGLK